MATDNTILSARVGDGDTIADFADASAVKWPAAVASYIASGSANSWTVVPVDITHGLPMQPMSGATWAVTGTFFQATQPVSVAVLPLPSGAATAANQTTEITGLAAIVSLLGGTLTVSGTVAFSNTTIAVTNTGTFAVQAAQSGTWNIINISGTISLPTGASTEATLSTLNGKVTACNTGAVVIASGAVTATLSAETTKVIGTVNQGTSPWVVSLTSTTITGTVSATQSGTWTVGLSSAQTLATVTTVGTVTTLTQWNAGHGTAAAALRVELPTDGTGVVGLNAGSALIGKVGIDQTTPGTTNAVQDIAATSGGLSISSFLSTAAVQATAVKASPGQVYSLEFFNINATPVYVRLYNMTTTPGTGDTVVWRGIVPGNTAGAGFVKTWDKGLVFSTGIGMRCTAAIADNDNTSLAANTVIGNVEYK